MVRRTSSWLDGRSVHVSLTTAGRQLIRGAAAAFEDEIAVLVNDLTVTERSRLSSLASLVAISDAKRREIDILDLEHPPQP